MSPTKGLDGVIRVRVTSLGVDVPDSLKQALSAQSAQASVLSAPMAVLASVVVSPLASSSVASLAACGSSGAFAGYTESKVAYAPEAIPMYAPYPIYDDKYIPDMPLGFSFSFHGNAYDKVNVFSNGFLQFGQASISSDGFYRGGVIPSSANPNNVIAFAWTDWSPQLVPDGIRYETRGAAPNRRFILQFTDVPEYNSGSRIGAIKPGVGRVTTQVVLAEGSNDITIYTTKLTITNTSNYLTQGIENASGTLAMYDSVQNALTGTWRPRVHGFFNLLPQDAIRFSLIKLRDTENPSIIAPANITQGNDPGLASAVVALGSATASDNCGDVAVSSARSDGAAIDAPYPVGVTTITWTATDAAGNKASATQTVTVLDIEPPVFPTSSAGLMAMAQSILTFNATSPSGAVVTYQVYATDNVGVTSLVCKPESGSLFPNGSTTVNCTASDAAGNTASESFPVYVLNADEQLLSLTKLVSGMSLANGTLQPLVNQLRSVDGDNVSLSCKKMNDFLRLIYKKQVNISPLDAPVLIEDANTIKLALGCE